MFLGDGKMIRKLTVLVVILALAVSMAGCRKKSTPPPPPSTPQKTEVKTQAQYEAQAKKDINSTNMQAELEKIEKDVQKETGRAF
jgi:predicted small lipoprotein YifL